MSRKETVALPGKVGPGDIRGLPAEVTLDFEKVEKVSFAVERALIALRERGGDVDITNAPTTLSSCPIPLA